MIIGAGREMLPIFGITREMGLKTVVTDMDPHAPGFASADDRIIASTRDIAETTRKAIEFHKQKPIDGVMTIANDVPLTVAMVARSLGLPEIPPVEVARIVSDKHAMKQLFQEKGIPTSWFCKISSYPELQMIIHEKGLPLIIKPAENCGGRGVYLLKKGMDFATLFRLSLSLSRQHAVLVEEFLEGPQVSTESIIYKGKVYTPGFSDRNYEFLEKFAPNIIENGGDLPSMLPLEDQLKIKHLIERIAKALGLVNGVLKGDMVLHRGEAKAIEVAGRLSGGYFCSHETPLSTGVNIIKPVIQMALGEETEPSLLEPKYHKGVCERFFFLEEGRIQKIEGLEQIRKLPWVKLFQFNAKIGDLVEKPLNSNTNAGIAITIGETRDEAVTRMQKLMAMLHITMADIKNGV